MRKNTLTPTKVLCLFLFLSILFSCSKDSDLISEVNFLDGISNIEDSGNDPDQQEETSDVNISVSQISEDLTDYDFNVLDFGAKGDGITDDREAIQAAIDAAGTAGTASDKSVLYIPAGTYILSRNRESRLWMKSNMILMGDGDSSVITIMADPLKRNGRTINCENIDNFIIKDITIDGNKNNVEGDGNIGVTNLMIANCTDFEILNITSRNSWYHGSTLVNVARGLIQDSEFLNVDCGIIAMGDATYIDILNNRIQDHIWSEGIVLHLGSHSDILINGNFIKDKENGHGIAIGFPTRTNETHDRITITNNTIINNSNGIGILGGVSKDIVISGNNIIQRNEAIGMINTSNATIANNIMDNKYEGITYAFEQAGIRVEDSSDIVVQDNSISNAGWDGVRFNNVIDVKLIDNDVISWGPPYHECIDIDNATIVENTGNTCSGLPYND